MIYIHKHYISTEKREGDGYQLDKAGCRRVFLKNAKTATPTCHDHSPFDVRRSPSGAMRIGCQRISAKKVKEIIKWLNS